jgi:hypothetical protein
LRQSPSHAFDESIVRFADDTSGAHPFKKGLPFFFGQLPYLEARGFSPTFATGGG